MKATKITLSNFRGAESVSLDLDERLNVFCGINGAGKSTVLDAVAIMLSWVTARIRSPHAQGRAISELDITNGKSHSSIELLCIKNDNTDEIIEWQIVKSRQGRHGSQTKHTNLNNLNQFAKNIQTEIDKNHEKVNLPLFVYYPVNRAVLDIPLRIKKRHKFNLLSAYEESLTSGANFRSFFEWFREREDYEIRQSGEYHQIGLFPDLQLQAVRQALKGCLPEFNNLRVKIRPLSMVVNKNDRTTLRVDQLSDGEKCLISMIGDLARRIAIANPARENPLEGEGIVLIDEIDLHLHPLWQRMIVPNLLEVFPNLQFIISTHSPSVLTNVKPQNLYILSRQPLTDNIIAKKPNESYGKTADRILEDLMGLTTTRPDIISTELHEIYQKIEEKEYEKAKSMIAAMKDKIGNDSELVKAGVLISRKEMIGK